jgi:hypothetical protein
MRPKALITLIPPNYDLYAIYNLRHLILEIIFGNKEQEKQLCCSALISHS